MHRLTFITVLVGIILVFDVKTVTAQVGINADNSNPDPSAMLDIKSTNKGMLTPRMNSADRESINNPADGLLVYDLSTASYWYYDEGQWVEIHNRNQKIDAFDLLNSVEPDFECTNINSATVTGNFPIAIDKVDSLVYVIDQLENNLKIYDVSDPDNPVLNAHLPTGGGTSPRKIVVEGNYAYVICNGPDDLRIYDVSDSTNPVFISNTYINPNMKDLDVSGNYAYLVFGGYMSIYNISNPVSPTLVSTIEIWDEGDLGSITVVPGVVAYITERVEGDLIVVDISNPSNPIYINDEYIFSSTRSIKVNGNYLYAVGQELRIFDISNPYSLVRLGSIDVGPTFQASDLSVSGKYAYVVSDDFLEVIDVSDPNNPSLAFNFGIGPTPSSIMTSDHYAFITDINSNDLKIIELGCPIFLNANPISGKFESSRWVDQAFSISDNDSDTKIQTQKIDDEDQIRFDVAGSEAMIVDNLANVGIGTGSPAAKLHVKGQNLLWEQEDHQVTLGTPGSFTGMIFNNDALGEYERFNMVNDPSNPFASTFKMGYNADGSNTVQIRNIHGGLVGIGRDPQINRLEVEGKASKSSAGDWVANSDARLKTNIQQLNSEKVLQQVLSLRGVTYEWADDKTGTMRPEGVQYGFTAQNIQSVFPEFVEEDAQGYLQTAYGTYDAMYVEAIRALSNRIENLESENAELKSRISQIEKLNGSLVDLKSIVQQLQADQLSVQNK